MDRDEAVKLLRGGKAGIAEWKRRRDTHELIPDLEHTDFSNVDMCDAELSGVNLQGANLEGVKLPGARLDGADLIRANPREPNFAGPTCHTQHRPGLTFHLPISRELSSVRPSLMGPT